MKLVPINEFEWPEPGPEMFTMTCVNHQSARYSTKNPFFRNIHVLKLPKGNMKRMATGECTCPFSDLAVIVERD